MTTRGAAFSVMFERPKRSKTPSMKDGDSAPKARSCSFQYLRKNDGSTAAGRPHTNSCNEEKDKDSVDSKDNSISSLRIKNESWVQKSQELRQRIANDMKHKKSDPFDVDIVVSKADPDELEELESRREAAAEALLAVETTKRNSQKMDGDRGEDFDKNCFFSRMSEGDNQRNKAASLPRHRQRTSAVVDNKESESNAFLKPLRREFLRSTSGRRVSFDENGLKDSDSKEGEAFSWNVEDDEEYNNFKKINSFHMIMDDENDGKTMDRHGDKNYDNVNDDDDKKKDEENDIYRSKYHPNKENNRNIVYSDNKFRKGNTSPSIIDSPTHRPVGKGSPEFLRTVKPLSRIEQYRQQRASQGIAEPEGYENGKNYDDPFPAHSTRVRFSEGGSTAVARLNSDGSTKGNGVVRRITSSGAGRMNEADFQGSDDGVRVPAIYKGELMDEELMCALEKERKECAEQRRNYYRMKFDLEKEREAFSEYRRKEESKLAFDRDELELIIEDQVRDTMKEAKSVTVQVKETREQFLREKEKNRRIAEECNGLREEAENLHKQLANIEKQHQLEVGKLNRKLNTLMVRNTELLTMSNSDGVDKFKGDVKGNFLTASLKDGDKENIVSSQEINHLITTTASKGDNISFVDALVEVPKGGSVKRRQDAQERKAREFDIRIQREKTEQQARTRERQLIKEAQNIHEGILLGNEKKRHAVKRVVLSDTARKSSAIKPKIVVASLQLANPDTDKAPLVRHVDGAAALEERLQFEKDVKASASVLKPSAGGGTVSVTSEATTKPQAPQVAKGKIPARIPPGIIPKIEDLTNDSEAVPLENFSNDAVTHERLTGANKDKREVFYKSGKCEIFYSNGTHKVILPDGQHTILHFVNGDVKHTFPSGKVTYWYSSAQTKHTQLPCGVQVFEFKSKNQTERHFPDGTKEILYPEGVFKVIKADGSKENVFPRGFASG